MQPDKRSKSRHGSGVAGLKLCVCCSIFGRGRRLERCGRQRFISAQRFATPAQDEITDRAPLKAFRAIGDGSTHADARAQELVGGLEPRCGVNSIAMSGIVEKAATTEIADQHWTGMDANPSDTKIHSLSSPSLSKFSGPDVEVMRTGDRARRVVGLVAGRVKKNMN